MSELSVKVRNWLDKEGYPTEFRTANIFRKAGFHVLQGYHVGRGETGSPREVDVLAEYTVDMGNDHLLRVYNVVECKASRDKPWVVFTDAELQLNPAALVNQTIGSVLGGCLLWIEAGNKDLHKLSAFHSPKRAGFGGRQVFSQGNDSFFAAIQCVTQHAVSLVNRYDEGRTAGSLPYMAAIAFPLIVVDGPLFEAYFCLKTEEVVVSEVSTIRCHWCGSSAWSVYATVDVVSLQHLMEFVERRRDDVASTTKLLHPTMMNLVSCFRAKSLEGLKITKGSRGFVGLHPLLREIKSDK